MMCGFHYGMVQTRNALPPVYPAGTVVRRSITSCPVQRIPIEDGGLVGVGDPAFIFRRQPLTSVNNAAMHKLQSEAKRCDQKSRPLSRSRQTMQKEMLR